jgi:phage-related protein
VLIEPPLKPLRWVGDSHEVLKSFPKPARGRVGRALHVAQVGKKLIYAKPLRGFGGASVIEIVYDFDGNAYRAIYTVRFAEAIYVLHVFQKKSKKGIKTPTQDIKLVHMRLQQAELDYEIWRAKKSNLSK